MTGTTMDGEDVVQDVLARALVAYEEGMEFGNMQAWLFRVAHNASVDFARGRHRRDHSELSAVEELAAPGPEPAILALSFRTFQQLPELPRASVILKDVLGHSIDEIAEIVGTGPMAVKAALQRGRVALRLLAADQAEGVLLPSMSAPDRDRMETFVTMFRNGDFDGIRRMLAADVQLDLVARLKLKGREEIGSYFTRYAELTHWRFVLGAVDGRPVMLVFDARSDRFEPSHYVRITWRRNEISTIRDSLFAGYSLDGADWLLLEDESRLGL